MALLQAVAALVVVLGLVVLAGRGARRYWPGAAAAQDGTALRLRATLVLDSRRRIHLVETDRGAVLVLTGGGQDQLVRLNGPAERA
jgi:flagellar biogenesis protein FliO